MLRFLFDRSEDTFRVSRGFEQLFSSSYEWQNLSRYIGFCSL